MQVKVFESQDMASGLKMIKEALGPEALILSTRTVRSGKFGLLGKPRLEITAAIDTPWHTNPLDPPFKRTVEKNNSPRKAHPEIGEHKEKEGVPLTYNGASRLNTPLPTRDEGVSDSGKSTSNGQDLQAEVNELKVMIRKLAQDVSLTKAPAPPTESREGDEQPDSEFQELADQDVSLQSLSQHLLGYGISWETTRTIVNFARESLTLEELTDPFRQQEFLAATISDLIQVSDDIFSKEERQLRLALVGPTGVGKTTTLAKLAARYLANTSPSIGLITIDTYRIAAVEQLKVYGEIMNLPVEVVLTPEQLEQALLNFRDKDLVLIDTAGRSPQDSLSIEELASFFKPELNIRKQLVLSATTRQEELFDAMHRFSILGIDDTIVTKIDECTKLGLLLDMQIREKNPFSYITNGQRVPEDLFEAEKHLLTQFIMTPGKGSSYE